ncbi:hypothetical protein BC830DRAFT_1203740 [Chytriomyces sp. MP71]|nr:hypothetical protein BC830DRAFT_1203740 [Chytriomyces sp. MP71]
MTMHKLVANMADWDLLEVLRMEEPGVIAVDGNLSPSALTHCLVHSKSRNYKPIGVFEPTSVPKSTMLFNLLDEPLHPTWSSIQSTFTIVTPNAPELAAMHMEAQSRRLLVNLPLSPSMDEGLQNRLLPETQDAVRLAWDLAHIIQVQLVKLGAEGALIVSRSRDLSSLSLKPGSKDYACTMPNGVHVLHLTSRHDAALPILLYRFRRMKL